MNTNLTNEKETLNEEEKYFSGLGTQLEVREGKCKSKCNASDSQALLTADPIRNQGSQTSEKLLKCNHCSYQASQKCNLDIHLKTHAGEKPFKCSSYPYKMLHKRNFNIHLRTHTSEKMTPQRDIVIRKLESVRWTIEEKKILLYCFEYSQYEKWSRQKNAVLVEEIKKSSLPEEKKSTPISKLRSLVSQMHKYLTEEEINSIRQNALQEAHEDYVIKEGERTEKRKRLQTKQEMWTSEPKSMPNEAFSKKKLKTRLKTQTSENAFKCSHCPYQTSMKGNLYKHFETHTSEKMVLKRNLTKLKNIKWTIDEKKVLLYCFEYSKFENWNRYKNVILVEQIRQSSLPEEKKNISVNKLQSLVSQMCKYLTEEEINSIRENALNKAHDNYISREVEAYGKRKGPHTREEIWVLDPQSIQYQENLQAHLRTHVDESEKIFICGHYPYHSSQKGNIYMHSKTHNSEKMVSQINQQAFQNVRWTIEEKKVLLHCFEYAHYEKWSRQKNAVFVEEIRKSSLPEEKKNTSVNKFQSLVSQVHKYLTKEEIHNVKQNALQEAHEDYVGKEEEGINKRKRSQKGEEIWTLKPVSMPHETFGKEYLKIHLKTQISEKPFKCNYCPYEASQKGNFYIHLGAHIGEEMASKRNLQKFKNVRWTIEEKKILLYCFQYSRFEKWNKQGNVILVEQIRKLNISEEKKNTSVSKLQSLVSQMHKYLTKEEINNIRQSALRKAHEDYVAKGNEKGIKKV